MIGILINPCGANGTHHDDHDNDYYMYTLPSYARGYDCCMSQFGRGEYGFLKYATTHPNEVAWSDSEALSHRTLASHNEVSHNIITVDENGNIIPYEMSRRADDVTFIDDTCAALRDPHPTCVDFRRRAVASPHVPNCWDHNQTVDAMTSCYRPGTGTVDGQKSKHCMQVGYSQNAFLHICNEYENDNDNDHEHCGTFLEIHMRNGNPYHPQEETVIASSEKITTLETNGMVTTTIPLTYMNNPNRILCAYEETKIRVGTMVRIVGVSGTRTAVGTTVGTAVGTAVGTGTGSSDGDIDTCCCPPVFHHRSGVGSYMCPIKPGTEGGPFADRVDTLAEKYERDRMYDDGNNDYHSPKCPFDKEDRDTLQCRGILKLDEDEDENENDDEVKDDVDEWRALLSGSTELYYSRKCHPVTTLEGDNENGSSSSFTSSDLNGSYVSKCPLGKTFESCGGGSSSSNNSSGRNDKVCQGDDMPFTFRNRVGKVVRVPSTKDGTKGNGDGDGDGQQQDNFGMYSVTFNDGRTSYDFPRHHLQIEPSLSNYEIWFVKRHVVGNGRNRKRMRVVEQKKGFRVIWPLCTFDTKNDRYFPYAQKGEDGEWLIVQ